MHAERRGTVGHATEFARPKIGPRVFGPLWACTYLSDGRLRGNNRNTSSSIRHDYSAASSGHYNRGAASTIFAISAVGRTLIEPASARSATTSHGKMCLSMVRSVGLRRCICLRSATGTTKCFILGTSRFRVGAGGEREERNGVRSICEK